MQKGFTLIELLVVVLIIGILASIAVPKYFIIVERTRAAEGIAFVGAFSKAQKAYVMQNGDCFANMDSFYISLSGLTPSTNMYGHRTYKNKNFNFTALYENGGPGCYIEAIRINVAADKAYQIVTSNDPGVGFNDTIFCSALKTNSTANKMCASLTGKSPEEAWDPGKNYYRF